MDLRQTSRATRLAGGKHLTIAGGPADYALFVGLMSITAVEAKRKSLVASGALEQAKR